MLQPVELLSCTQINPFITTVTDPFLSGGVRGHDLAYWGNPSPFTDQEKLIEYAGRVCYHSTDKMGQSPSFIKARMAEGHEDIIEHVFATFRIPERFPVSPLLWRNYNPYCTVSMGDGYWIASANLRAWRDLAQQLPGFEPITEILAGIAPGVFADIAPAPQPKTHEISRNNVAGLGWGKVGQARVTLLAANYPEWTEYCDPCWTKHGAATFLLEGVSRTLTHQLVRHRRLSFSQASQRYIELSKGQWSAIVPPAVADNPGAAAVMEAFWTNAETTYQRLRDLGIRKEDARFILPGATETRLVVSGPFDAWRHFNELRALDKAAQWEIRNVGQVLLRTLWMLAPSAFGDQWSRFIDEERVLR